MSAKRLPLGRVIADIQAGIGNTILMQKYELSLAELAQIRQKLAAARCAENRETISGPVVASEERRTVTRHQPVIEIKIYDAEDPRVTGSINDVSTNGVQVAGISARPGEVRTFAVHSAPFEVHEVFVFKAECRWSRIQVFHDWIAGFVLLDISDEDSQELDKLISYLTVPATGGLPPHA
jgi:hypothetical protein